MDLFINSSFKYYGVLICQFVDRWIGDVQHTTLLPYVEEINSGDLAKLYLDYAKARVGDTGEHRRKLAGTMIDAFLPHRMRSSSSNCCRKLDER